MTERNQFSEAYEMFRAGMDTATIAKKLGRKEQFIHREINHMRSLRLGLPTPYDSLRVLMARSA